MLTRALKNKVLFKRAAPVQTMTKNFSSNEVAEIDLQHVKEMKLNSERRLTQKEMNEHMLGRLASKEAEEKEYVDMLGNTEQRQAYFRNLAQPDSSDHSEIAKVKAKINKMIDQELELSGFKDQLTAEERNAL